MSLEKPALKWKAKQKNQPKVKQLGLIGGFFFFFPPVAQFIQQLLNAAICRIGRVGIKDTKRTNLPMEDTDVEIGDYSPVE